MRLPQGLKRVLLLIWNRGHQLGWKLGEYADAFAHGRIELCSCCGRCGLMLFRPRAIPARLKELWGLNPRTGEALARKETLDCSRCDAKLRARRMATVLMTMFPVDEKPPRSLREWAARPEILKLDIAEVNRVEGLHEAISKHPGLLYSEYFENAQSGTFVEGVRCETLSRLTYADASFDLVLTSETLEHVPRLELALSEIHRVLKPGGLHVFTVPLMPGVAATYPRREITPEGQIRDLAPPICHPGGDVGYPVTTEIGRDFPTIVDRAGFVTEVLFGPVTEDDLAQVFVSRKV